MYICRRALLFWKAGDLDLDLRLQCQLRGMPRTLITSLTIVTRETSETSAEISRDKAARTLAHTVSIIASPRVPPSQAPRT